MMARVTISFKLRRMLRNRTGIDLRWASGGLVLVAALVWLFATETLAAPRTATNNRAIRHAIRVADLHTKEVSTLQSTGLSDAVTMAMADIWPNLEEIALSPHTLRSRQGQLVVNVQIPAPFKLNPGSPIEYRVDIKGSAPQHGKRTTLKDGKFPLHIPLTLDSETAEVQATVSFVYCRDGNEGVCVIQSFRWTTSVKIDKAGEIDLLIDQVLVPRIPAAVSSL